jgi:hypothetical protein
MAGIHRVLHEDAESRNLDKIAAHAAPRNVQRSGVQIPNNAARGPHQLAGARWGSDKQIPAYSWIDRPIG